MGLIKKGYLVDEGVLYIRESMPHVHAPAISNVEAPIYEKGAEKIPRQELPQIELSEEISEEEFAGKKEEFLSAAKSEAEEIISKAMSEAEAIKEQARSSGIDEARVVAEESASDKVKEAVETLNQAVIERKKIIKDAESEILRLAIKVSEQIIKSEVLLHRDVCLNIVADAINKVSDREQVIVKVNREDLENIKKYKDRLAGVVDGIKSFSIVEDAGVEPGGCVIETNLGYIDARISTKIAAIEEAFRKAK